MANIDVEKIADSIRPKEDPKSRSTLLIKEIFKARDIKDLTKRRDYIKKLIEGLERYDEASLAGVAEELREFTKDLLVARYKKELTIVEDLLYLTKIVTEYNAIDGRNERQYYLLNTRRSFIHRQYYQTGFYTKEEVEQIINILVDKIEADKQHLPLDENKKEKLTIKEIALYCFYCEEDPTNEVLGRFMKIESSSLKQLKDSCSNILHENNRLPTDTTSVGKNQLKRIAKIAVILKKEKKIKGYKKAVEEYDALNKQIEKIHGKLSVNYLHS